MLIGEKPGSAITSVTAQFSDDTDEGAWATGDGVCVTVDGLTWGIYMRMPPTMIIDH